MLNKNNLIGLLITFFSLNLFASSSNLSTSFQINEKGQLDAYSINGILKKTTEIKNRDFFKVVVLEKVYGLADGKREELSLTNVVQEGNKLIASPTKNSLPQVVLEIKVKKNYSTLEIVDVVNPKGKLVTELTMLKPEKMNWMPCDGNTKKSYRLRNHPTFYGVEQRTQRKTIGKIAMWIPTSHENDDEILYHVWAHEDLPKPNVKEPWTVERAKLWINDWVNKYGNFSKMYIGPRKPEDLTVLADRAHDWGLKNVYMHLNTWGDRYWATDKDNFDVNRKIFPKGKKDMIAFGQYLKSKGMGLTFRTTSYSIGTKHPDYASATHVDERLATWWRGTLAQDFDENAKEIVVQEGREHLTTYNSKRGGDPIFNRNCMQIGSELLIFNTFEDNGDGTWTLKGLRRGDFNSKVTSHKKGEKARGVFRIYGWGFAPDPDSSLVDELGKKFAEFHNEVNANNCNFDALEVHNMLTRYGDDKFMGAVYRHIKEPLWSDTSGGDQNWGFFEKKFHKVRKAIVEDRPHGIPHAPEVMIGLHKSHWSASSPYAYNYSLVPNSVVGHSRLEVQDQSGYHDVRVDLLENHGLAPLYSKAVKQWRTYGTSLPESLKTRILSSWRKNPFNERYTLIDELFRFEGAGKELLVVPFQMMKRRSGDRSWTFKQEHGTVYPYQYIRPGTPIQVNNPYHAQVPEFIIRVMPDFNRTLLNKKVQKESELSTSEKEFNKSLDGYLGSSGVSIKNNESTSLAGKVVNYNIMFNADQIKETENYSFEDNGSGVKISYENNKNEIYQNVKDSTDSLPWYLVNTDITKAGGLGVVVTGDGSGAILVIRIKGRGTRDYLIHLDFKGKRYVEIPSPQVSWADENWPFVASYKRWRSNSINRVAIGLDRVPANTKSSVLVEDIRFLAEKKSALVNPIFKAGKCEIRAHGDIESNSYIWYRGGEKLGVYDLNWNKIKELPIQLNDGLKEKGYSELSVVNHNKSSNPWLEVQFFVQDEAIPLNLK